MGFTFMRFGARLIRRSGLLPSIETLEAHRGNLLRILVYHRIGDPGKDSGLVDPTLLNATPEQFEQQMRFLCEHYRLLSIRDLLQAIETKESLPPKSVMVTFDDGYCNFLETAWPILERYHIPALLFLTTGFLSSADRLFWWDRLYQGIFKSRHTRLNLPPIGDYCLEDSNQRWEAFIQLKRQICHMDYCLAMPLVDRILDKLDVILETTGVLMNWSEARFLNEHGCYLAAHTRNHPILSQIPLEEARQEIRSARQDLCREIGIELPVFSYPSGHSHDYNNDLFPILREEGFKLAMTSIPGINDLPRCDLLQLKRIGLSPRLTLQEFQVVLTGIYHLYSACQNLFSPL